MRVERAFYLVNCRLLTEVGFQAGADDEQDEDDAAAVLGARRHGSLKTNRRTSTSAAC